MPPGPSPYRMNVREYYQQELAARGYKPDEAQERAVDRLQQCYDE